LFWFRKKQQNVCPQDVYNQTQASQEAEAKQTYSPMGENEDREYDKVQCQEAPLA